MQRHRLSRALLGPLVAILVLAPAFLTAAEPAGPIQPPSFIVWFTDLWTKALASALPSLVSGGDTAAPAIDLPAQPIFGEPAQSTTQLPPPDGEGFPKLDPDG